MATIGVHYLKGALQAIRQQGFKVEHLLARVNISSNVVNASNGRVHTDQMSHIIRMIVREADDEFLGFLCERSKPGSFALLCELCHQQETLRGLFTQGGRFYNLTSNALTMALEETGDQATWRVQFNQPNNDKNHFFIEFWLVIWHRLASWAINEQLVLDNVYLRHQPNDYLDEFQLLFNAPNSFNQPFDGFSFERKFLDKPLVRTQNELQAFIQRAPLDFMTMPGEDKRLSTKVHQWLMHQHKQTGEFPEVEAILSHLHCSEQTLRRKLHKENSSFQKIKNELRRDLAIEMLLEQKLTVTQVAEMVGFTEPRSFSRAFKQWTGVTPGNYRKS